MNPGNEKGSRDWDHTLPQGTRGIRSGVKLKRGNLEPKLPESSTQDPLRCSMCQNTQKVGEAGDGEKGSYSQDQEGEVFKHCLLPIEKCCSPLQILKLFQKIQ